MDYKPISSFLERIKNIVLLSDTQIDLIQVILKKSIKKEIPKDKIIFKKGVLSFDNLSPIYKNEIFINKNKILEDARSLNINILDIK